MKNETRKEHWDKIYSTKQPSEVSWTQENPKTSLDFIHSFNLPKQASIIDIGGGDSRLVDKLIDEGYEDVTVLTPYKTGQESENRFVTVKLGKYVKRKKIIHTGRAIKPSAGSRTGRLHGDLSQV